MLKPYQKAELSFQERKPLAEQGKNSRTYIAHDAQLDAEIVIKEIPKNKLDVSQYFDEARLLYASAHSNVVQIHYACEDSKNLYIAMPYYERGSLKKLMGKRFLTVREILSVAHQILAGLHNVHSKRLVHLDVKPDNVLFSARGEGLLSDFGLSKRTIGGVAEQDYMYARIRPPESYKGAKLDVRSDIYQVGVLLYRMCNGNTAFDQQFQSFVNGNHLDVTKLRFSVINERFPDRSTFLPHVPERIRSVIKRCLKADPTERYTTALDVSNELAHVEDNYLDWQMTITAEGRKWEKVDEDGRFWEFEAKSDESTCCYKTINGGKRQRVTAGTTSRMTPRQVRTFLGER